MAAAAAIHADAQSHFPPAVQRFIELLDEKPKEFDIAILGDKQSENLKDALVLHNASFLGVHALDLPPLARQVRQCYWKYRQSTNVVCDVTKCLLLLCPDHATAWADRRRYYVLIMQEGAARDNKEQQKALMLEELAFLDLLMTRHTKAPTSWWHRKWVLEQLFSAHAAANGDASSNESDSLIRNELTICTAVAERYPKNYYAWTHRLYCLRKITKSSLLVREEWDFVLAWLPRHVSDHSAVHYSGQVLLKMMDVNTLWETLLLAEEGMQAGRRLVQAHPAHEVLWIFRRVCAATFLQLLQKDSNDCDQRKAFRERFVHHVQAEWKAQQSAHRPKIGSEADFEWRRTRVCQLSFIVWASSQCRLVEREIREQAVRCLSECDFIPHNLWRTTNTGL